MTAFLLILLGCASDAELSASVDEAACAWVARCSERYASADECLVDNPSEVVAGCTVDAEAVTACLDALEAARCPEGEAFVDPPSCDTVWVCEG